MPKLFLSYRRHDSADATGRLHDRLIAHFGRDDVFIDVDGIPLGVDFRAHLSEAVGRCDVLLAVIGDHWLGASFEDGPHQGRRRLDDARDWVRTEIETALARGIPVVPVLVGQASMPAEADLPDGLKELAYRNAAAVRPGSDFPGHLDRLIRGLEQLLEKKHELREGVRKAIRIADEDPEMGLARARKVLELVVRDVYERRYQEPPGTRPLEGLIRRLAEDGHLPDRFDAATVVRQLGSARREDEGTTATSVSQSFGQLMPILDWYLQVERPDAIGPPAVQGQPPGGDKAADSPPAARPASGVVVVPKGLRSFDAGDADFFLGLLPGPRDKDGLPESIRFWKHRAEGRDEPTFTVGAIYGPSGCGKSSLVKAGLLPRLAGRTLSVYVEATAGDTEARLLRGLRRRCPDLPGQLGLAGAVAALRRGQGLGKGQKVFIVLDQFEQWLHARRGDDNTELAQALRQCDGEHVQCVVLVRDDFWLALSRFMTALHIELLQGQNIALVDLFDPAHARNVLSAFGRAFGRLPADPSREQESFLDEAVAGLSQAGRVISVRLALFAEMVKGKPWTPATLKEVGGTEGVGASFLEETFASRTANPRHRTHERAARAVLKALLPEQGSDIKGNMQSHGKLLQVSGYARRPQDFEELLRILDSEVRLITPTEPAREEPEGGEGRPASAEQYYQLTHDYLVHSLREWLTRKQKETRKGRAELRLSERTSAWSARPENRHLPAWWEWLNIRLFTRKKDWAPPERTMMRKAGRYHVMRGSALAAMLLLVTVAGLVIRGRVIEENRATHAAGLVRQLLDAEIGQVPPIVTEMGGYRRWTDPLLRDAYARAEQEKDARRQLHAGLALLPVDDGQVDYLYERLLDAEPQDVAVIRDALRPHRDALVERLWGVVEQPPRDHEGRRLRAACVLAAYDPDSPRWGGAAGPVAGQLVAVNPIVSGSWIEGFRPVKGRLLVSLAAAFRDRAEGHSAERGLAASILADYADDQPDLLAELIQDADERQFAVLFPALDAHRERAAAVLGETVNTALKSKKTEEEKEALAKRQANAAVALLRMGEADKAWRLLRHGPDPRVRSYLIHRLGPLGADPGAVVKRLDEEPDVSTRRALLLALGEFGEKGLAPGEREVLLPKLFGLYRDDPDAGLHGSAEWLLLRWGRQAKLKEMEAEWREDGERGDEQRKEVRAKREARLERIREAIAKDKEKGQWYVNARGQTMVVVPGPVEFLMGSPKEEAGRNVDEDDEGRHLKRIGRSFAIAAKPVTVAECRCFEKHYTFTERFAPTPDCPGVSTSWYQAAAYCNWLSEREGIDEDKWCYEKDTKGLLKPRPNYLSLTGYRLPTEAEWEHACRAGAVTSRYYGESAELLGKYAWYQQNSGDRSWPAGGKKPNDFGLFDMHGNVWNWCQEQYDPAAGGAQPAEDIEPILSASTTEDRVLRGGSFYDRAVDVRCANRSRYAPAGHGFNVGFRPARTFR